MLNLRRGEDMLRSWGRVVVAVVVPAIVVGVLAYHYGPKVDAHHPATALAAFFSSTASVLAAVLVAIAVLSVMPAAFGLKVHGVIGSATLAWLALGEAAALTGLVPDLVNGAYRVCFGVAAGATLWVFITMMRVAATNLSEQFKSAVTERGDELAQSGASGSPQSGAPSPQQPGAPRHPG
jgi:hypothetical protein